MKSKNQKNKINFIILAFGLFLVLSFQNCGANYEMGSTVQQNSQEGSIEGENENGDTLFTGFEDGQCPIEAPADLNFDGTVEGTCEVCNLKNNADVGEVKLLNSNAASKLLEEDALGYIIKCSVPDNAPDEQ